MGCIYRSFAELNQFLALTVSQIFRKLMVNPSRGFSSWAFCILIMFFGFLDASALNFYVDSASQFNAKLDKNGSSFATLRAGDRVYLKGGNWGGLIATLYGSMTDAAAQANPAVIYACDGSYIPTVGGVTVTGLSQISLTGSGIVFAGVTFGPTSGMYQRGSFTDYGGNDSSAYIFQMEGLSRYMTLSHLNFDYCGRDNTESTNDHYGAWISINGFRHTIQYCEIQGRDFNPNDVNQSNPALRTSIRQATVIIYKASSDVTDWGYHTVRYNYFGERKTPLTADGDPTGRCYTPSDGSLKSDMTNGWETIRVGNSSYTSMDFNTTVEYNTFYHSIYAVDGGQYDNNSEPEAISNKSRKNTYRYNTILNNYGQLCLRQGDYCVVQGNYFLAGGAYDSSGNIVFTEPLNDRMGGVRAFGFGHIISNNYFYNIRGSGGLHSALMLGSGSTATGTLASFTNGDGASGYETANYTHVIGNTFIDCTYISLDSTNGETYPVYGTQFFNNLIYYRSNIGASGIYADTVATLSSRGGQAQGNYIYSSSSSQLGDAKAMLGSTGNTITSTSSLSPAVTDKYDIMLVPTASSPALGKAATLPVVSDTSLTGSAYSLAADIATYGGVDIRGWSRPSTARDVGNYERESTGSVTRRPMRRSEVGRVASTYLIQPTATVTLGSLVRTYSGSAISATAVTNPTGLAVNFTYNGSATPPIAAGNYTVVGTVNDVNYTGNATGTLVISKAVAPVSLGSLTQAYTGTAKSATAVTTPTGLTVSFTYNGTANAPTNAGNYTVVGTVSDVNYIGNATGTLVVSKSAASVSLGSLVQTYTGNSRSASAVTTPTGLTVSLTYNGTSNAPTNAGNYTVVGTVNDVNYTGNATGTLVISKGVASVSLESLAQTYTGSAKSVTAVTTPLGLTVGLTYNGSVIPPTSAGNYTVVGTVNDVNYAGNATGALVISKGVASVSLGNLTQTYTGNARAVTAVTTPSGLAVNFTYNGSATSPTAAGNYTVVGTINDLNYTGNSTGTLVISKADASLNLGSLTQAYTGTAKSATAVTTPSGLAVGLTYNGTANAPTNVGNYTVVGTINDLNYTGNSTGTLVISKGTASVSLGSLAQNYTGSARVATAVTAPSGLTVDLTYDGTATAPTSVGNYTVVGMINDVNYMGNSTGTLVVSKGAASVTLGDLTQTYTGSPRAATAVTNPVGLNVNFTYNGSSMVPLMPGSYTVIGTVDETNYAGNSTGTLVISKLSASVGFGGLLYAYDGALKSATVVTVPAGLSVNYSYMGSPLEVGSYPVVVTVDDAIYSGSASGTLVITPSGSTFATAGSNTWTCPANVHSVEVQCWGGGGAGGSARRGTSNAATGGGGAGGSYAKLNDYPVTPGATYYLSIGTGGISSSADGVTSDGGDTWFNSVNLPSTMIVAKGGAGGATAVTTNADKFGAGGLGSSVGSVGDVVYAGGSGATSTNTNYGGGGGGSGGTAMAGLSATSNSGLGAVAVMGGGNGGAPNAGSGASSDGQTPTFGPGGGGGGARSAGTSGKVGGRGASGQLVLTLNVDTIPGSPTQVTAKAENSQVRVSFLAPTQTGGPAITGYTVTASPGGASAVGMNSPITVAGLSNGTPYTFIVRANNILGSSLPSLPSAAVAPATVPTLANPSSSMITASGATLGGIIDDDGGASILERGMVYSRTSINSNPQIGGTGVTSVQDMTNGSMLGSFTVGLTDLTPHTEYAFAAYATNEQGTVYSANNSFVTLGIEMTLTAISLSAGTLDPVFAPDVLSYTIAVSNETSGTTVTAVAGQANTTVSVNGGAILSGVASSMIPLVVGDNSMVIVATSQDGSISKTYTVTVRRESAVESWRQFYFNTGANAGIAADGADSDGDGLSNAQEYIFGSSPIDADRGAILNPVEVGGKFALAFLARQVSGVGYLGVGRYYTIESTSDLENAASWAALSGYAGILGSGQTVSFVPVQDLSRSFYRLKVEIR